MAPDLPKDPNRAYYQTNEEWLAELNGDSVTTFDQRSSSRIDAPTAKTHDAFQKEVRKAGIIALRRTDDYLLVTANRYIGAELDKRIRRRLNKLVELADPWPAHPLYVYTGYRTMFSENRPFLVVEYVNVNNGEIAERYFNIHLRDKKGKSFPTGRNRPFRIKGTLKRPSKNTFIDFWMKSVGHIPENRVSHIYRYMNPRLTGLVVSCNDSVPHHGFIKLKTITPKGKLYNI